MKVTDSALKEFKTISSTEFDAEKTKELIDEMRAQGMDVSLENLSQYLKQQGVLVDVHVGGGVREYGFSVQAYGIDKATLGDETKELFSEHVKNGKISFLPQSYEKRRQALASNLRMTRDRQSIGYEKKFLTIETYKEYYKFFLTTKEDYFALRDEIMVQYDALVDRFKMLVRTALSEMRAIDLENEYNKITSQFGSYGTAQYDDFKKKYVDGFYMSLSVKAFPVVENLNMFEDGVVEQIKEGIQEDSVRALYDIIGSTLNDGFQAVSGILKASANGNDKIYHKTMGAVKDSAKRIAQKNVFANRKIESIRQDMLVLSGMVSFDKIVEKSEHIIAKIYSYAMELRNEHLIQLKDCPLTQEELIFIASLIVNEDAPEVPVVDPGYAIIDEE